MLDFSRPRDRVRARGLHASSGHEGARLAAGRMKREYDFKGGRRGAVVPTSPGKTRITIRSDDDVLAWFRTQVHKAGGGSYQTAINDALHRFIESAEQAR